MFKKKVYIACYHGVYKKKYKYLNKSGKHIFFKIFENQIKYLKKKYEIISMRDLALGSYKKTKKDFAIITFDDGYKNVYENAFPILKKYKVKMTFYITTSFIEGLKPWTDILEFLIFFTEKKNIKKSKFYKNYKIETIKDKNIALQEIKKLCKSLNFKLKNKIIKNLTKELGSKKIFKKYKDIELYKFSNWKELKIMKKSKLIDFGAHSCTHEILTKLPLRKSFEQISNSINILNKKLNFKCDLFAYPNGQKGDFNLEIINFLKKKGVLCSPSAISGINQLNSNLFRLKRTMVGFEKNSFIK